MYDKISNKYTSHIAESIVRRPKSKIVVGGLTYTGETALMSFPKISHSAERMIGVFPSKTCEFELLNKDGSISLNGKEVTVYRGIEIDGETEWVPMGIFSATDDNITNELTKRTIRFKGTDHSARFDTQFVNDIKYPISILDFIKHICTRHGVELETTSFPFASKVLLSAPNADASISDREIIARIAELSGCLAVISREGGLRIFKPESTGKTVNKRYYKTVSQEPKFGAITAVTLGHSNYTDDIVYPEGATNSSVNWRIEDNPFVDGAIANDDDTPAIRADIIADVAQNIIGRSIIPFSVTDFIDDYIYDLGDVVTVEKKDGSTFETVILNISSNSRIRSNIGAATQTQGATNYAIAGSTKQQMQKLALEVDYQAGVIRGVVEDNKGLRTTIQALSDKIDLKFEDLTDPDHLDIENVTSISAEGVKIYNGMIQIFQTINGNNEMIFGTDENGSLGVTGNIKVKFKNAKGSDTATLKISNEDFKNDISEYATASIKVSNNSGNVFASISMWEYENVGTMDIRADNISITNENGDIGINIGGGTGTVVYGGLNVLTGNIEAHENILLNGILKSDSSEFCGFKHTRKDSYVTATLKPGVGVITSPRTVDFEDNNLGKLTGVTANGVSKGEYYIVTSMSEKKLYQLSKLRSALSVGSVVLSFDLARYGFTDYWLAYTTSKGGSLKKGVHLIAAYNDTNFVKYTGDVEIPSNAVEWCIAVEQENPNSSYWAGWKNVTITERVSNPTASLELDTVGATPSIICRLDCIPSPSGDYVELRGAKGSSFSKRLGLGTDSLFWGGSIAVSSEKSIKTNIQSASSVLDKICNSGIYSYNYRTEEGTNSPNGDIVLNGSSLETTEKAIHYGLVIGDGYNTPEEVISSDGKHVDLYSMIALAWKAIQELATKFDTEVKK